MWFDRLLMLVEVVVLLWMLRLDRSNQKAIQAFLQSRTDWYARRARLRTMQQVTSEPENKKTPETNLGSSETSEIVTVLEESSNEQEENS